MGRIPEERSPIFSCRACNSVAIRPVLSLGRTPLANALLTEQQLDREEAKYDLDLVVCNDCSLVQITTTVPPAELFREYVYFSSFSDTMLRHAQDLVSATVASRSLDSSHHVVEVASNDGYLLQHYLKRGIPVLGVEPAENIATVARQKHGVDTICEFFDASLARRLSGLDKQADVIHAHNVLAHVPNPNSVVAGFHLLLKPGGTVIVEVPYLKEMIDRVEFDTIYHEHMSYFSLTSLNTLFDRHGMTIIDVEQVPIHGGSLRIFAERAEDMPAVRHTVGQMLAEESGWVRCEDTFQGFANSVHRLREQLTDLLQQLKRSRERIAVYGASAKGSTLLNFCGVGKETIDFVVDRSTVKQGRYTPGSHLRIYSPDHPTPGATGLYAAAHMEFCRRDSRPTAGVPGPWRAFHHSHSRSTGGLMIFEQTALDGVIRILVEPIEDERGFFARTWCQQEFETHGLMTTRAQCSVSYNHHKGTIRGMHYQAPPHEETKLIRCVAGSIHDVVVDIRPDSPTYLQWAAFELTAANRDTLYLPGGFAHGFQTLEDATEVQYQMSVPYVPECSRGIAWNDPTLDIRWPLPVTVISEKDRRLGGIAA